MGRGRAKKTFECAENDRRRPCIARLGRHLRAMKIDFVSDVACPWCAVGLWSLEQALERLNGKFPVELRFEPFELNPAMPPEGEDATEHLSRKYGAPPEQLAKTRAVLRERGAAVGFSFGDRPRVWNTFDAHRLIHWAGLEGKQRELKHALLTAYHTMPRIPARATSCCAWPARSASTSSARERSSTPTSSPPRCASASAIGSSSASIRCRR